MAQGTKSVITDRHEADCICQDWQRKNKYHIDLCSILLQGRTVWKRRFSRVRSSGSLV